MRLTLHESASPRTCLMENPSIPIGSAQRPRLMLMSSMAATAATASGATTAICQYVCDLTILVLEAPYELKRQIIFRRIQVAVLVGVSTAEYD